MSKMLNLDELAAEKRVLQLKGKEYEMKEVTVGDFINMTKMEEDLKGKELTFGEQLDLTVEMIAVIFPVPKEDLRALSMRQLNAILEFANASAEEVAKEAQGNQGN